MGKTKERGCVILSKKSEEIEGISICNVNGQTIFVLIPSSSV